jgi:WD repeat-containing protein 19
LAVLQEDNNVVPIWNLTTRRLTRLDTNLTDLTFLKWSKTGYDLAIGTAKGNLLIYKASRNKKIPVMGKHTKVLRQTYAQQGK